jgi:hypothetical protein
MRMLLIGLVTALAALIPSAFADETNAQFILHTFPPCASDPTVWELSGEVWGLPINAPCVSLVGTRGNRLWVCSRLSCRQMTVGQ